MTKKQVMCLRCGNVQVRTDIEEAITDRYIVLKNKNICPKCTSKTNLIVTENLKTLRKQLLENSSRELDSHILKFIRK